MSKFRGTRSRFRGLRDLLDPGEVYPLFNFNFNFNSPSLVCSPLLSHGLFIYLCRRFIMPSSRAPALVAFSPPSPSPPFELFDRWGVANGLLIFFFLAKKMFKLKKFRFVASTRWFREDSIESFVCLVAFCFTIHGNVI